MSDRWRGWLIWAAVGVVPWASGGLHLEAAEVDAADARGVRRVLFAGSSSVYFNDMPLQLENWLSQGAGLPTQVALAGRSGSGIHVYLRPGYDDYEYGVPDGKTFLDVVAAERYDLVVLMAVARFITGDEGAEHASALDVYCQAIKDSGGEPVIYEMGWGHSDIDVEGRRLIFETAVRNGVRHYVPCSTAWARVRDERPDLALQDLPDTAHPGALGCYLNLCCFYRVLSDQTAIGLPPRVRDWAPLSDERKAELTRLRRAETPAHPYVVALPGWMQTRSMGAVDVEIPAETALYLQSVADEECRAAQERLQGARAE